MRNDRRFMQSAQVPEGHMGQRDGNRQRVRRRWSEDAEVDRVPGLRTAVCTFAAEAGVDGRALSDVRLALSEAITNAVVHSYRNDAVPGKVTVSACVCSEYVRIVVGDKGMGSAPRLDSPGTGLGLPLIAALTHSFEIRDVSPTGTDVHMAFKR